MRWLVFSVALSLLAQGDEDLISRHADAASAAMKTGGYALAEEHYRAIVRLRPKMAEAEVNLGLSCFLQKKYEEALGAFGSALKLNPELVNAQLFAGISQFNLHRPAAAAPYLVRYTKAKPSDVQGQYFLGLSYLALEKYADAERVLRIARDIDPGNVDVLYHLAQSFLGQARKDASRRNAMALAYQDAVEQIAVVEPASFRLAQLRAGAAELEGDKAEAIRQLEDVLKDDPKTSGIHYALGCLYTEARQYDKALPQFQAEMELNAPYPRTYLQLGHVYVALEKPREALPILHRALAMDPGSSGLVWVDIAHAYRMLNEPEKSISAFEKAIELGQGSASIYYQLGFLLKRAGHPEEAQKALATSQKLRGEEDRRNGPNPQ
jgi:tetratricopeptide (TPR) repeat protein